MLIPTTDLVFYALGSGEYDEMARELILFCRTPFAKHLFRPQWGFAGAAEV